MNILIVNAFGNSISGKNKFNAFLTLIKTSFKKVSENSGIEKFNYIIRTPLTIGDFTYSNFTNPFEETSDSKYRKNFNSLDMVFIDGCELFLPWKPKSEKLFEFIKLCKMNNKALFAAGVAFQTLIYYLSTNSMSEYTIINNKGEIKAIEELQKFPTNYFKGTKTNEIFLDYVTGDLLGYRENDNSWEPIMNIGLHHQISAEKYFNRGKFVLGDNVKYNYNSNEANKTSNSFYYMKDIISNEIKVITTRQNITHYLLQKCSSEFNAICTLEWFPHFINVTSKKYQFKIICQSNRGPSVIEHENTIGVLFHPNSRYWDSSYILKNFINEKFNEVKDKILGVKSINNKDSKEGKNNSFFLKFLKSNNDNTLDSKNDIERENDLYGNNYSLIKKVAKSCLFNKTRLVKHDAKHVGQGINNREMIFVENNNINQRILFRYKNSKNLIRIINNENNIINKENNKKERLYKTPRIMNNNTKIGPRMILNKESKGNLTSLKKIKMSKDIFKIINANTNSSFNKNKIVSKSQKLRLKNMNFLTERSKNHYNILKNDRVKPIKYSSRDKEDMEDFNNYKSKYPRLPTSIELENIKTLNFKRMVGNNYESKEINDNEEKDNKISINRIQPTFI